MATITNISEHRSTLVSPGVPYGYCHCGCGEKTPIAKENRRQAGIVKGEPLRFISGHNARGGRFNRPLVSAQTRAALIELDNEIDVARIERVNWQRAVDADLRALQDYVHDHQAIIWHPGDMRSGTTYAQEVHLVTPTCCTCSRFKLRGTCLHMAFLRKIEELGVELDMNTPVHARDLEARR